MALNGRPSSYYVSSVNKNRITRAENSSARPREIWSSLHLTLYRLTMRQNARIEARGRSLVESCLVVQPRSRMLCVRQAFSTTGKGRLIGVCKEDEEEEEGETQ